MIHLYAIRADSDEGGTTGTRTVSHAGLHGHFTCRGPFHRTRFRYRAQHPFTAHVEGC